MMKVRDNLIARVVAAVLFLLLAVVALPVRTFADDPQEGEQYDVFEQQDDPLMQEELVDTPVEEVVEAESSLPDEGEGNPSSPEELSQFGNQSLEASSARDNATNSWDVAFEAIVNTTTGRIIVDRALIDDASFDSLTLTATMSYQGKATRQVTSTFGISDFDEMGSVVMDFQNYGRFTLVADFSKDGVSVSRDSGQIVGIVADTYNISPVSATLPVTFFSLSLWGDDNIRESGPVILLMERPAAYDWNALPSGVYGLPFLSLQELSYQPGDFGAASTNFRNHEQAMADYVRDLMEISPDAHYNLYCVDYYADLVQRVIYANGVPQDQYSIFLLSDGSFTPAKIASVYDGADPATQHAELVTEWNQHKANAYANGAVDPELTPGSCGKYLWAIVDSEPNAQLWVARKDLLKTPNDGNAFGQVIQANPKVVAVSIGNMLKQNIQVDSTNEAEFKALYNFNDSFFAEAEAQGRDVMMFLGTRVTSEQTFVNYARFVMSYYGDEYVYYYKGHPGTPTDLYPEKVDQLKSLGITDVDASIAAELILFFNPEIYLSGYASSTYASVPVGMGKGMFNMTRAKGLSDPQYENMDFWMTMVTGDTDERIRVLCASGHDTYLVEFCDSIAEEEGYVPVGQTGTRYIAIWDATTSEIVYYCLNDDESAYVQVGSESGIDPASVIPEGTYVIQSSLANGKVLDVSGGSKNKGANVQLYSYNGSNAQKWDIAYDEAGYATIMNVGSGLVLDVSGGKRANGTNVQQWTPNGSLAQKWRIVKGSSGGVSIISALDPTIVLDIAGAKSNDRTNCQIYAANGSMAQSFVMLPLDPQVKAEGQADIEDGYYTIVSAAQTNLVLAPSKRAGGNGTNVQVEVASGAAYQLFKITRLDDGFYRIESASNERSLDLDGGKVIPGTNVHLWSSGDGNQNQEWAIVEHTGGSFTIQNVKSGLMLDLAGGKKASGTNVDGHTANGTQAQRWLLHAAKDPAQSLDDLAQEYQHVLSDGVYVIHSSIGNGLVLDVRGGSVSNKANVQTWTANGTAAQEWVITHDEKGYVILVNKKSGLALDVAGGKAVSGTNVWQYAANDTSAQRWIVLPAPSGGYEIISAFSPYLTIDISGASTKQGGNVQLYSGNGSTAQRFTFEKVGE